MCKVVLIWHLESFNCLTVEMVLIRYGKIQLCLDPGQGILSRIVVRIQIINSKYTFQDGYYYCYLSFLSIDDRHQGQGGPGLEKL